MPRYGRCMLNVGTMNSYAQPDPCKSLVTDWIVSCNKPMTVTVRLWLEWQCVIVIGCHSNCLNNIQINQNTVRLN